MVAAFSMTVATPVLAQAPTRAPTVDAEMRRTGQVGTPDLHGERTTIHRPGSTGQRTESTVRFVPSEPAEKTMARINLSEDPLLSAQYGEKFVAEVEKCRFRVARRWGTTPAKIVAGTITVRWTLEPSGNVRDVTATPTTSTNKEVMACARSVVAGWSILNPVKKVQAVEWTHTFTKITGGLASAQSTDSKSMASRT
jgi:hypothetical protein